MARIFILLILKIAKCRLRFDTLNGLGKLYARLGRFNDALLPALVSQSRVDDAKICTLEVSQATNGA